MIDKIMSWFKKDEELNPSDELRDFLNAKDLDVLLEKNLAIKELNQNDSKIVYKIITNWKDKQAISNLLFYPRLIPEYVRAKTIIKGLNEQEVIYYNLAAIVGLQEIKSLSATKEESDYIHNKLFSFIREVDDIRAMRATSTLHSKISKNDISKIIECGSNKNGGVRTNLIAMISKLYDKENIENQLLEFKDEFKEASASLMEELNRQKQKIEDAPENKKSFFKLTLGMSLMGYIPNMDEVES